MSKPVRITDNNIQLSFRDYYKNKVDLKKYKLPELKELAREHKLKLGGAKPILIERIDSFFNQSNCASILQRVFRGFIVRFSFSLRGKAFHNRKICVNESDFVTLEPLEEISHEDFYSYMDSKEFTYGFSLDSLMSLFKQKGKIVNPYNREKLDFKTMNEIFTLFKINRIIYPHLYKKSEPAQVARPIPPVRRSRIINVNTGNSQMIETPNRHTPSIIQNTVIHRNNLSRNVSSVVLTQEQLLLRERMNEIQNKPTQTRIQELFMEIDQLGNYTQSSWFSNLPTRDYVRLYRYLNDIWRYRGHLSEEIKRRICSIQDPFANSFRTTDVVEHNEIQKWCLNVMEYMVYTGIDVEYQKLGALHVLSALTIVSLPARQNMMWLYESLVY